jgi:hypothetical protein
VGGEGGIATGADTAVIQLSALNATTNGYLDAYEAGTSDPGVSELIYDGAMTYRDIVYVPLSSAGQITITNHGTAPVDLIVVTRGYFMPPSDATVGAEYAPVSAGGPVLVYGSASGGTQLGAWSSVTFQVAGAAGLPASGVVEVAEHVVVTHPTQSGFLDAYRGGGTDPDNATMNFDADDNTDVGYQDSILSSISPTGQETIKNHSSGTIDVQVAVVGMFFSPQAPPVPTYLQTAGTDSTTPTLSGIVQASTGDDPVGEIFLFDSSGNPIGGSPTATGQVESGEAITWPVTPGTLTNGSTYQWYMEACDQGVCSAPTATQTFTVDTGNAPAAPVATATATITGGSLAGTDAISDPGACSGSDCPVTSNGTLKAGYDGASNWVSGLAVNLSAIPAGSSIVSATLQLTEAGCLTGTSCASSAVNVYQAGDDVTTAASGADLAADEAANPMTAIAPATQGSWDLTAIVSEWMAGDSPNHGLVIASPAGTSGISYYSASATPASDQPQLTIGYIPPALPGAPEIGTVMPGDGGVLATWTEPAWNYLDDTDTAIETFTVEALTSSGTVAASQVTGGSAAVLTGLSDGTTYTVSITATNAVGTSSAATSAPITPTAVPGGPTQYVNAVSQYLNGQDALDSGTTLTASSALSGDGMEAADLTELSDENLADNVVAADYSANDEQDTNDSTSLANTLAILSPDGSTVMVYATANESFTTIDNSTGSAVSVPGSASNDYMFTFSSSGSNPQLAGYVDADAALDPIGDGGGDQTAFSDVLDGPAIEAADDGAPTPLATSAFGQPTAGSETVPGSDPSRGDTVNEAGVVSWAEKHAYPGTKRNDNFHPDCTDFASRAIHIGGGMVENLPNNTSWLSLEDAKSHLNYWFDYHGSSGPVNWTQTSYSWADAHNLSIFFKIQKAYFMRFGRSSSSTSNVQAGMIIFGAMHGGGFGKIDHTGVITKVTGKNIFITQHSINRLNEPLWKMPGEKSWFSRTAALQNVWIFLPTENTN